MRLILFALIFYAGSAQAGIFGASSYEECIDDVVKNVKIKEALAEGESNCYEKHIRPKQNKLQNTAWQSKYRPATPAEISQFKCKRDGKFQNYYFITCSFSDLPVSNYAEIKINVLFKDGRSKDIEFKNYAPNLNWGNKPLGYSDEVEIQKIDNQSLKVKEAR
jgi:hypothetical protein